MTHDSYHLCGCCDPQVIDTEWHDTSPVDLQPRNLVRSNTCSFEAIKIWECHEQKQTKTPSFGNSFPKSFGWLWFAVSLASCQHLRNFWTVACTSSRQRSHDCRYCFFFSVSSGQKKTHQSHRLQKSWGVSACFNCCWNLCSPFSHRCVWAMVRIGRNGRTPPKPFFSRCWNPGYG